MNRSQLLDILRIVAICLVFIAHFGQLLDSSAGNFFGIKNFYYVSLGGLGVSMFLLLSGILAGLTDTTSNQGYANYLLKKVLRIYPLYWMSIPLSILGYLFGAWLLEDKIPVLFPNGLVKDIFFSLTGFYSWIGLWGGPYNSPSWFIALIMTMYALFPLIYFLMKKRPHLVIVILFLVSLTSRYYVGQHGIPLIDQSVYAEIKSWFYRQYGFMPGRPGDWFPPARIFEFGLGIYLALVIPKSFWLRLNISSARSLQFLSDLAFPLFLIHYPFMFLVLYFIQLGMPLSLSIVLFMMLLILACQVIIKLDSKVPRKLIMSLVADQDADGDTSMEGP